MADRKLASGGCLSGAMLVVGAAFVGVGLLFGAIAAIILLRL